VCALGAAAMVVAARVSGSLADWYPFPVATVPPITLVPVLACLLLTAPLVAWRRS
jgi:hypothetical protein